MFHFNKHQDNSTNGLVTTVFCKGFWTFFFFFSSEQKKNGGNTDLIPPEVSLNYLEKINRMKPMCQHTLDT